MVNIMKKYVVTGAGGFIGSSLCLKLITQGNVVYGIDVFENEAISKLKCFNNFLFIRSGYSDYSSLKIEGGFDFVIHVAWGGVSGLAYGDIQSQMVNITGAINVVEFCSKNLCNKLLFVDSSHEYQKNTNKNGEIGFCSLYGAAKKAAHSVLETLTHNLGISFYSAAFTTVYGFGDYSHRSTNAILESLFKKGYVDLIEGDNLHDWTYIDDAVDGLVAICDKGKPNVIYYIGSTRLQTFKSIIERMHNAIGNIGVLNIGKYSDTSFVDYSFFDLNRLYEDTGFKCQISVEQGTLKTVEWLKRIGRI